MDDKIIMALIIAMTGSLWLTLAFHGERSILYRRFCAGAACGHFLFATWMATSFLLAGATLANH